MSTVVPHRPFLTLPISPFVVRSLGHTIQTRNRIPGFSDAHQPRPWPERFVPSLNYTLQPVDSAL